MSLLTRAASRHALPLALAVLFYHALTPGLPAYASPVIGTEFPIGAVYTSVPYNQELPKAAAGGDRYLVVWQDRRSATDYDIYGALVNAAGAIIGDESFLISSTASGTPYPQDQYSPAVAFNGTNFLVVWTDKRVDGFTPHIYGARVSTSGVVLDPGGIAISSTASSSSQSAPAVASNGATWEVVWQQQPTSGGIFIWGANVSASGVVTLAGSAFAGADGDAMLPAIAWNGSNYLLVWVDNRNVAATYSDIWACKLTSAGAKVASSDKAVCGSTGDQLYPSVAAGSGTWCLVTWEDWRGSSHDIYGARVDNSMTVSPTNGSVICNAQDDQDRPCVTWDGTNFLVAWRDKYWGRVIRGTRVNISGTVLDPMGILITTASGEMTGSQGPGAASLTGTSLVLWYTLSASNAEINGNTVSSAGAAGTQFRVSQTHQDQPSYAAAFDGTNYVVVWSDNRSGAYNLRAARVTPAGSVIDAQGVALNTTGSRQSQPAIAWGVNQFLVVWAEKSTALGATWNIRGLRIRSDLTLIDSAPFDIAVGTYDETNPSVAWAGGSADPNLRCFLVVWEDYRYASAPENYSDIFGARVLSNGTVEQITDPISDAVNSQRTPSVCSNGLNFVVAWADDRGTTPQIYCSRVDNNGTILNVGGVRIASTSATQATPRVAFDGTNYLFVWSDNRTGNYDIRGVRTTTALSRLDGTDLSICTAASSQSVPWPVWASDFYYIVWEDSRNAATTSTDIYLNRVSSAGAVQDGQGLLVSAASYAEMSPVIAASGTGRTCAFYSGLLNNTQRLAGRTAIVTPATPVDDIRQAKALPNGTRISIANKVVTAGTNQLGGMFYIEETNRLWAIKVVTGSTVNEGDLVTVTGTLATVDGERQITADSVVVNQQGVAVPQPLQKTVVPIGGGPLNEWTPGPIYGTGVHTGGILVKVFGFVRDRGSNFFYLDDYSGVWVPSGQGTAFVPIRAKVVCPAGVTIPANGTLVSVVGCSSIEKVGEELRRMIRLRKQADLVTAN